MTLWCATHNFQVNRLKISITRCSKLKSSVFVMSVLWLCVYLADLFYIDGSMQERRNSIANTLELRLSCTNPSICVTNTTHEVMMCHTPFPFQRCKSHGPVGSFGHIHSVSPCQFDWLICGPETSHKDHFWVKRPMVKVTWVVGSFCDICSLAIWPIHFIWGTNKTHGGMTHYTPLPGQKVNVIFLLCLFDRFAWYKA